MSPALQALADRLTDPKLRALDELRAQIETVCGAIDRLVLAVNDEDETVTADLDGLACELEDALEVLDREMRQP